MVEEVLIQAASRRPSLVQERRLCRIQALIKADLAMVATIVGGLINVPGFIVAAILSDAFDLHRLRQAASVVLHVATSARSTNTTCV